MPCAKYYVCSQIVHASGSRTRSAGILSCIHLLGLDGRSWNVTGIKIFLVSRLFCKIGVGDKYSDKA